MKSSDLTLLKKVGGLSWQEAELGDWGFVFISSTCLSFPKIASRFVLLSVTPARF